MSYFREVPNPNGEAPSVYDLACAVNATLGRMTGGEHNLLAIQACLTTAATQAVLTKREGIHWHTLEESLMRVTQTVFWEAVRAFNEEKGGAA